MVDFDPERLNEELAGLSHWQRVAFATSCVEVLVPSYRRFSELEEVGDADLVESAVNAVWDELERTTSSLDPSRLLPSERALELMPEEEDWNEWAPQAENSITALVYLLRLARQDETKYAVYAAQHAYEAVDEFVARERDLRVVDTAGRAELLQAPLIQDELHRQNEVLRILRDSTDGRSHLPELRGNAQARAVGGRL